MSSPYADLRRPPLHEAALRAGLVPPWRELVVLEETGSTNADLAEAARRGAPHGIVLVAEHQTAGRGRAGRSWISEPRAALTFSVLLRPTVPAARWPLLSLVAGSALAAAVEARTGVAVGLKWPNDLLTADGRKLAGILVEVAGDAAIVGVGLNVSNLESELPPGAASLVGVGAQTADRSSLLRSALRELDAAYSTWSGELPSSYLPKCETIGRRVRVELPGGATVSGTATGVDDDGRLVTRSDDGVIRAHAAGDVVHVRPGE